MDVTYGPARFPENGYAQPDRCLLMGGDHATVARDVMYTSVGIGRRSRRIIRIKIRSRRRSKVADRASSLLHAQPVGMQIATQHEHNRGAAEPTMPELTLSEVARD